MTEFAGKEDCWPRLRLAESRRASAKPVRERLLFRNPIVNIRSKCFDKPLTDTDTPRLRLAESRRASAMPVRERLRFRNPIDNIRAKCFDKPLTDTDAPRLRLAESGRVSAKPVRERLRFSFPCVCPPKRRRPRAATSGCQPHLAGSHCPTPLRWRKVPPPPQSKGSTWKALRETAGEAALKQSVHSARIKLLRPLNRGK